MGVRRAQKPPKVEQSAPLSGRVRKFHTLRSRHYRQPADDPEAAGLLRFLDEAPQVPLAGDGSQLNSLSAPGEAPCCEATSFRRDDRPAPHSPRRRACALRCARRPSTAPRRAVSSAINRARYCRHWRKLCASSRQPVQSGWRIDLLPMSLRVVRSDGARCLDLGRQCAGPRASKASTATTPTREPHPDNAPHRRRGSAGVRLSHAHIAYSVHAPIARFEDHPCFVWAWLQTNDLHCLGWQGKHASEGKRDWARPDHPSFSLRSQYSRLPGAAKFDVDQSEEQVGQPSLG